MLLDCAAEAAETLQKRLSLYRLRAKVDIVRRDDLAVLARWDGENGSTGWWRDPRLPALGWRTIVEGRMPPSRHRQHRPISIIVSPSACLRGRISDRTGCSRSTPTSKS